MTSMSQTNLSKLEACRKLAGGKAASRRPRFCALAVTAPEGRRNRTDMVSGCGLGFDL
jgi:hypothetical protein